MRKPSKMNALNERTTLVNDRGGGSHERADDSVINDDPNGDWLCEGTVYEG